MTDASQSELDQILASTDHRPYPLPKGPWRLRQRWNDLLFCHWPLPPVLIQNLLPPGLAVDTFDEQAWIGVIPFWMDRVRTRILGNQSIAVPTTTTFPELNLRTYVRSRVSGLSGVYFFSLDCASPLAVFGARTLFHLPYFPARMSRTALPDQQILYKSHRQLTSKPADYESVYGPREALLTPRSTARPAQGHFGSDPLARFLTERYCLFTPAFGRMLVGHIHHVPWPLEPARAEIRLNQIPAAHSITLPDTAPILHFSRELQVLLWGLETDRPSLGA
jgi:uncharacterized protein YqjF (DUF2071 family)